jgi:glutathione peroxidase
MNTIMRICIAITACAVLCILLNNSLYGKSRRKKSTQTAYDFSFISIDGKPLPLSDYQGKVLLIVNTASYCGFTPQYKKLEELYQRFKNDGLIIIGVPSNDFGQQEPGGSTEISCFIKDHYPVTFPITQKEIVKGKNAHPFYVWVGKKAGFIGKPQWNFHKYLIDRKGHFVDWFASTTSPLSTSVIAAIKKALAIE